MSGFFYNLGRKVGRKAVPSLRKSKLIWDGLTGDDEESLQAEAALGKTLLSELLTTVQLVTDPATVATIQELCSRMAACLKRKDRQFSCDILRDDTVSALCLPGGYIFVSDSLMRLCENQADELAFVIGHEMGHIVRGHVWERMLQEGMLRAVSSVVAKTGSLSPWLRQGVSLARSSYSSDAELEADEFGCRLAVAAGFAPEGAIFLLQRLGQVGAGLAQPGSYIASHPPASERISHLRPVVHSFTVPTRSQP